MYKQVVKDAQIKIGKCGQTREVTRRCGDVHYGGEGPHWTAVPSYNNNNNNNNNGGKLTILWNQKVQTDRTIPNNEPDIIIRDNEKGTCMLIDVAISGDRNVIRKEAEKI